MTKISKTRFCAVTAMLAAVSIVLMQFEFSLPFAPPFLKMDISDLPALIGTFAFGPICGTIIELIKNLLHLFRTSTGGVGELSNAILGISFVIPAGILYQIRKTKKNAFIACIIGALIMALVSIITNYFVVYPVYYNFMPKQTILKAYQLIFPGIKSILQSLIFVNVPFTFIKGILSTIITLLIYKPLSPIIKGRI